MPIPDYQQFMLPVLKFHEDGAEHNSAEVFSAVARTFGLTPDEIQEKLPSGQTRLVNRILGSNLPDPCGAPRDHKARGLSNYRART